MPDSLVNFFKAWEGAKIRRHMRKQWVMNDNPSLFVLIIWREQNGPCFEGQDSGERNFSYSIYFVVYHFFFLSFKIGFEFVKFLDE